MWKPVRRRSTEPASAGIFNIEVSYPSGEARLRTGCEDRPVVGTELEPGWFVTGVTAVEKFRSGFPVDFAVTVAASPQHATGAPGQA